MPRPSSTLRRFRTRGHFAKELPGLPPSVPTASTESMTSPCSFPETSAFRSVLSSNTDTQPKTHTTPDPSLSAAGSAPPSGLPPSLPFIPLHHSHFPAPQSSRWEWGAGKGRRRPRGSPAARTVIRQVLDPAGRNRQQPVKSPHLRSDPSDSKPLDLPIDPGELLRCFRARR